MFSNLPYTYGEGQGMIIIQAKMLGSFYVLPMKNLTIFTLEITYVIPYATVSQIAFTYANPQIVKLDGIRGKFFL